MHISVSHAPDSKTLSIAANMALFLKAASATKDSMSLSILNSSAHERLNLRTRPSLEHIKTLSSIFAKISSSSRLRFLSERILSLMTFAMSSKVLASVWTSAMSYEGIATSKFSFANFEAMSVSWRMGEDIFRASIYESANANTSAIAINTAISPSMTFSTSLMFEIGMDCLTQYLYWPSTFSPAGTAIYIICLLRVPEYRVINLRSPKNAEEISLRAEWFDMFASSKSVSRRTSPLEPTIVVLMPAFLEYDWHIL